MKKRAFILSLVLMGALVALYTSCEKDPVEECVQEEEICEGADAVTTCCTDGAECYYTYNGFEFPDTEAGLERLFDSLGCAGSAKSSNEEYKEYIIAKLQALLEEAKELSSK